jgi:alpha-beta hydrolase superfamily lysophospholipase
MLVFVREARFMRNLMAGTFRHVARLIGYGLIGVVLTVLVVVITHLNDRPDLAVWHTVFLDEEFTEDSDLDSFTEYLALEDRLFQQLDEEVYAVSVASDNDQINRYSRESMSDPGIWPRNWNRSYVLEADSPRSAVLLIHGLSDSPYSLRQLAETLHAQGNYVLGLRVPGHGTAPSGLVRTTWQDMAGAVRLAVKHLAEQNPGIPIYIVGYSNGAALALNYELDSISEPSLPGIDRLVLISPEIAVTPLARFAKTQSRLGRFLGLEKLAWNDILPEYEPYKYGSFAVNAGKVSYDITRHIQGQISQLEKQGKLDQIAPVLAFSSVVDATVDVLALVQHLFLRLPAGGHELVLFDINHNLGIEQLLSWNPAAIVGALSSNPEQSFTLRLLTNNDVPTGEVQLRTWPPGATTPQTTDLQLQWPDEVFSLTHVALPFAPSDPLYGGEPTGWSPGISLGNLALRGERGVLQISSNSMLRLRWNPFYSFMELHALEFLGLEPQ